MKNKFSPIYALIFFLVLSHLAQSQVAINTDGSNPDASSILDIKSTNKGILIPRMTTMQRTNIVSPAKGLLVFDNDTNSFWFFDGSNWLELITSVFERDNANNLIKPNTAVVNVMTDDFVFGSPQLGDVGNSDHDQRFFFDKSKGAFRAGDVKDNSWDDANVGDFSVAFGKDTKANGKAAFAAGRNAVAAGDYSFALGDGVQANQNFSLALGNSASSTGIGAVAVGDNASASGLYATALGYQANAGNTGSVVIGYNSNAGGLGSTALGYQTNANNTGAVALGYNVTADGLGSTAVGYENTAPSAFETTGGLFATNYTPNSATSYHAEDRLFTIGNGINSSNRSDAFMILKNGNTFINGALTLNNAFTFPTADGTNEQVLRTNGSGTLSWTTLTDNDNQMLSLSSNTLSLTNGGSVDLTPFTNAVTDADNDTKIQVEESADEDIIRFDISGDEVLRINKNGNGVPRLQTIGANTIIGEDAGTALSTGTSNTFIGKNAGASMTTNFENTFIGFQSGQFVTGIQNTVVGKAAGRNNNTGTGNTFLGFEAGLNAAGNNNVFIGIKAGRDATSSHRLYIDNTATNSPLIYGEFDADLVRINGDLETTGNIETTGITGTTGTLQVTADVAIGQPTANAQLHVVDNFSQAGTFVAIVENTNGGVYANGLQIKAGQDAQTVNNRFISFTRPDGTEIGAVRQVASNSVDFWTPSDRRLKTNIQTTTYGLNNLMGVEVVDYHYKSDTTKLITGFIAQQLYEHYPEAVSKGSDDVKNDPWMVNHGKVTPLLVKAVQEQQRQIEDLKKENEQLKVQMAKIQALEAAIEALKAAQ